MPLFLDRAIPQFNLHSFILHFKCFTFSDSVKNICFLCFLTSIKRKKIRHQGKIFRKKKKLAITFSPLYKCTYQIEGIYLI